VPVKKLSEKTLDKEFKDYVKEAKKNLRSAEKEKSYWRKTRRFEDALVNAGGAFALTNFWKSRREQKDRQAKVQKLIDAATDGISQAALLAISTHSRSYYSEV